MFLQDFYRFYRFLLVKLILNNRIFIEGYKILTEIILIFRYIGSNVVSKSITAGDTVESNNFINIIDGVLSINFGNVDVPAGLIYINLHNPHIFQI